MTKRKVIIITDGDEVARRAVEAVARKVGGRCISLSAGHPTPLNGREIVQLVKKARQDPVLVMLDDGGKPCQGPGEEALGIIARHPDIELLGVVAVASNTPQITGVKVDESITREGLAVETAVDKQGYPRTTGESLMGDTVDVLNRLDVPVIVGTGDTGKMDGADSFEQGVPVTTKAVEEILKRSGF